MYDVVRATYKIRQYSTSKHAFTSHIVMICISSNTYRNLRSVRDSASPTWFANAIEAV
jgi:hypothetical protein